MDKAKVFLEKWRSSLVICLLPIISYFVLGPLEIYFGNEKEFVFSYTDFLLVLVGLSVVVWLVISVLISLLPEKLNKVCNVIILFVGVASYIQKMFMNIKLSEVDGTPMKWEELGMYPIINLIIWLVILVVVVALSVFMKTWWKNVSIGTAAFLSIIQLVAVMSLLLTATMDTKKPDNLQLSGNDQFKLATDENIVIFVLDTYGNTRFEAMLAESPEVKEQFSDFTYYNNADCHYYCTFPSMTHMMTGIDFDFEAESAQAWLRDAWNSDKAVDFFDTLKSQNYVFNLFSSAIGYTYGSCENMYGKIDNVQEMEKSVNSGELVGLILKMSAYCYAPYAIKPQLEVLTHDFRNVVSYSDGKAVLDDNSAFYQALLEDKLSFENDWDKAIIIQHLFGVHAPYTIDERANQVDEAQALQTARGLMVIVKEYLDQMKELGVYDSSTIIITADHGSWWGGDTQPVYLIKESNVLRDEMVTSTAPISSDDFQATILTLIGEDSSDYGKSIYEWQDGEDRKRTVHMPLTDEDYPNVSGSAWNVYYRYEYLTDRTELNQMVEEGKYEVKSALPWE